MYIVTNAHSDVLRRGGDAGAGGGAAARLDRARCVSLSSGCAPLMPLSSVNSNLNALNALLTICMYLCLGVARLPIIRLSGS